MFAFEKGALAGVFFHDLFEQMDFAPQERESRAALVKLKLAQYGFEPRWRPAVTDLLQQVIELEFPDIGRGFHLGRLTRGQRRHEMEFYFALKRLTPDRLVRLLEPHFSRPQRIPELDRIKALTFSPARGFVKGFIDMVFSYRGKYYLVDWKSNHLGSRKEDYGPESLLVSMQEHLYGLQSLLYTLALDQYLRARLPAYRYETHFGGAYYLFVRGMRADWGASYGIFKQRPAPAAIRSIREALIPRFPEIAGRQGRWRNAP